MRNNISQITINGHLAADPEPAVGPSGDTYARLTVYVNPFKKKGVEQPAVKWPLVVFNSTEVANLKLADVVLEQYNKGDAVSVTFDFDPREEEMYYIGQEDGQSVYKPTKVSRIGGVVDTISKRTVGFVNDGNAPAAHAAPASNAVPAGNAPAPAASQKVSPPASDSF